MDEEIRKEVLRLKREKLRAQLLDMPFIPTEAEKKLLEKWEAEKPISIDATPIIIPPTGRLAPVFIGEDSNESFLETKELIDIRYIEQHIQEQRILNEKVKVLFSNDSLMDVYNCVNIPSEKGRNIEDYDEIIKQRREKFKQSLENIIIPPLSGTVRL